VLDRHVGILYEFMFYIYIDKLIDGLIDKLIEKLFSAEIEKISLKKSETFCQYPVL
jgi:hypothetical protein